MSDYQPASSSQGSPMLTATLAVIGNQSSGQSKMPATNHNSSHHHTKKVTKRKSIPKKEEEEEEEEHSSVDFSPAPNIKLKQEEEEEEDFRRPIHKKKKNRRQKKQTAEEVQKFRHKQRVRSQKLHMSHSLKSLHMSCESMVMSEENGMDEYSSHSTCGPNDSDIEMMQKTGDLDATQLMEMIKLKISGHHLNLQTHALPDGRNSKKNQRRFKLRNRRRGANSTKT